jgi:hypothetical protein
MATENGTVKRGRGRPPEGVKLTMLGWKINEDLFKKFQANAALHVNAKMSNHGVYRFCLEQAMTDWIKRQASEMLSCPRCLYTRHRTCFTIGRTTAVQILNGVTQGWEWQTWAGEIKYAECPNCGLRFELKEK